MIFFEIFSFGLFYNKRKIQDFSLLKVTYEIIRFESTTYLVIEQNLWNCAAKVKFMKMSTPQEKTECIY